MASTEVERQNGVDIEDVPSADWGWSKENTTLKHIGLLLGAAFLLAMLRGNHVGRVEDWFVITFAAILVAWVVRDWWLRRRGWIR